MATPNYGFEKRQKELAKKKKKEEKLKMKSELKSGIRVGEPHDGEEVNPEESSDKPDEKPADPA